MLGETVLRRVLATRRNPARGSARRRVRPPKLMFETGKPIRYHLPLVDARVDLVT